jgi:hypothetical protein
VGKLIAIEIDVTYRTLFSRVGSEFTEDSKEYILVQLDENGKQIGDIDYGYSKRRDAERVVRMSQKQHDK